MTAFSEGFKAGFSAGYFEGSGDAALRIDRAAHEVRQTFVMGGAPDRALFKVLEAREERRRENEAAEANRDEGETPRRDADQAASPVVGTATLEINADASSLEAKLDELEARLKALGTLGETDVRRIVRDEISAGIRRGTLGHR